MTMKTHDIAGHEIVTALIIVRQRALRKKYAPGLFARLRVWVRTMMQREQRAQGAA